MSAVMAPRAVAESGVAPATTRRGITMHPCQSRGAPSTLIEKFGYDPESLKLFVDFVDGSRWAYLGVNEERFKEFLAADSKGRHLRSEIARRHEAERL